MKEDEIIEPEVYEVPRNMKLKKHNAVMENTLIEARYSLTLEEQRLVLATIAMLDNIETASNGFPMLKIPKKLIIETTGIHEKNYHQIKTALKRLMQRIIEIETIGKDGKRKFVLYQWFSKAEYEEGGEYIEVQFHPDLKPYLLELKERFTKIPLKQILQLRSKYAIRLYELLKRYEDTGFRNDYLPELRKKLGVEDKEYPRFEAFERKVLKPAVKEINEKTDLEVSYKKKKTGRKITHIEFTIKSKKAEIGDTTQTTKSLPQSVDKQGQKKVVSKDSGNSDKEIFLKNKSAVKYMDHYWKEVIIPAHKKGELNEVHLRLLKAPFKAAVYDEEKNVIYIPAPDAVYKSFLNNEIDRLKQFLKERFNISDVVVKEVNLDEEEDTTQTIKSPSKSVDTQGQKQGVKNVIDNFPPDDLYRNVLNLLELNYNANPDEIDLLRYYTYAIYKTDVKPKEMIITTDVELEKGKAEIRKVLKKYFEKIKEIVRIDTYNNYTAKIHKKLLEKGQDLPNWMEKGAK